MPKDVIKKLLLIFISIGILAPITYLTYDGYRKSVAPSAFELAATRLGFNGYKKADLAISMAQEQEALLQQLQIAGYFKPENLWQTVNHFGLKNPDKTFIQLYSAIKKSGADQDDPSKFNAKILRKNFGKETELDKQDTIDLILYIAQNAFGRMSHQERNELASQDWMNKYKHEYFETAKLLQLIDREIPKHKEYDEAWIAGASRIGVLTRIVDYQYVLSKYDIKIKGNVKILAGERELWANIDGISPVIKDKIIEAYKLKSDLDTIDISLPVGEDEARIQEGQEYLLDLATRYQISLNSPDPFIQYTTKEECPIGRFPGRIYPNYTYSTSKKLTESLMSQDLINTYFKKDGQKINVINTLADQYKRPTTGTTARDAATQLVKSIINGDYENQKEFIILFETNNPYIERQTIATQREVNKILKDYKLDTKGYLIKIDGIGFKCNQDVATVHSEFAALIAEKWKTSTESRTEETLLKRPIEQLQFQTRDNSFITLVQPDVTKVNISQNLAQDFFDQYLP